MKITICNKVLNIHSVKCMRLIHRQLWCRDMGQASAQQGEGPTCPR